MAKKWVPYPPGPVPGGDAAVPPVVPGVVPVPGEAVVSAGAGVGVPGEVATPVAPVVPAGVNATGGARAASGAALTMSLV